METITSQHRWNRLPVNTCARLTFCGPDRDRHTYVTRVQAETGPAEGEGLSLGGTAWRDAFNDADVAHTLFIPANHRIDIYTLGTALRRFNTGSDVEIACNHRRFRVYSLLLKRGAVHFTTAPVDDNTLPTRVGDLDGLLSGMQLDLDVYCEVDGVLWSITGARQEGETALLIAEPAGFLHRYNEVAERDGTAPVPSMPEEHLAQLIIQTESSIPVLEARVANADRDLKERERQIELLRFDLATALYLTGATDELTDPEAGGA